MSNKLSKYKVNTNYVLAVFVQQFNFGARRKLRFIKIFRSNLTTRLLWLLYFNGIIRTFVMRKDHILVYYKYYASHKVLAVLSLVSKPGKRIYWSIQNLSMQYSKNNFEGFYIISTSKGLLTSENCSLRGDLSGEVILRVDVV